MAEKRPNGKGWNEGETTLLFGFIGMGRMGGALARNLIRSQKEAWVFDRVRGRFEIYRVIK
jgi:6-phosphogluconate dehydrogenase